MRIPASKGDVVASPAVEPLDASPRRALWGVVELQINKVEPGVLESLAQVGVRDDALRSGAGVVRLAGVSRVI